MPFRSSTLSGQRAKSTSRRLLCSMVSRAMARCWQASCFRSSRIGSTRNNSTVSSGSSWTAPKRNVSCYEGNPSENAWHDYFSDHGGEEGRPDIEEEIDVGQLKWSAAQVHSAIDAEAALFGGDYGRVGVIGQSQGSCTALYSVLTHKDLVAGVFCSIGQLYSHAPVPPEKKDLQFYSFNGAADDCIACCLSLRTYSRLLEAGYKHVRMHVEPHVGHEGSTDAEADLVAEALESWGLLGPP